MRRISLSTIVVCMLLAAAGFAQETTGAIKGQVSSQDGATLPGVTLTLSSAATGLERIDVTNTNGEYQFMALPPGRYDLSANLDGFQTYKRAIDVALGRTVKNDFTMALGAITDVIEVTGEAPLVDVTSAVSGVTLNAADIDSRIPVVQDTQRIAMLAPATTAGDTAFNGAGDGTYDQKLVSIGGASVAENSYQMNGLNITNFRTGVGSSWIPFQFVEEVQVKTGGYEAEFGRSTGGVVNMVTKSGANSMHGGVNVYYEPESLQAYEPDTLYAYNQMEERENLELNLSLGGALVKDTLFYFGFLQYRDTDYLKNTTTTATREYGSEPYYGLKLDWNLSAGHRLEATYLTDSTDIEGELYPIVNHQVGDTFFSEGVHSRGGDNGIFKYTGIFSESFLLSAQYGINKFDRTDFSDTGDLSPYAYDATSGVSQRLPGWFAYQRGVSEDERVAYRIDGDLYAGNHSLRAGLDREENNSFDDKEYSGGYRSIYYLNQGRFPDLPDDQIVTDYRVYQAYGSFDVESTAAYVQDSWAMTPNLTVNIGVRWEMYKNLNMDGDAFVDINNQYAPRLGAIWDPTGEGRSKLYASYGRYHLPIASNTNIRMSGSELYTRQWFPVEGFEADGTPIGMGDPLTNIIYYSDGTIPDPRETTSGNLKPMAQDELILGYEQMVGDNWSVGGRFVARDFASVIEDIGGDWALYNIYGISTREGGWWGILANPGENVIGYYDTDGDGEVEEYFFSAEDLEYPDAERKYYAVELTAKRRFSDRWMLDLSYTWSHCYGNYEGYVDSTIGQSDGGITQLFDYPGLMEHSYGNLPNDRRHNLKAYGVYSFDMGLQLGGFAYFSSGRPISAQGVYPDSDNWAWYYGVASFYNQGVPAPRGSYGTTDDVYGIDAMLKYDMDLGPGSLSFRIDVFNLFDNDAVTEVDEDADNETGNVNDGFLTPTHFQSPRTVRLGFGYTF